MAAARKTLGSLTISDGRCALDLTVAELFDLPDGEFRAQVVRALNPQAFKVGGEREAMAMSQAEARRRGKG
jgi:hypothetical protein